MGKLTPKETEDEGYKLSKTAGEIVAFGELFQQQHRDPCYSGEVMYNMGGLIISLGKRVKETSDLLMYGEAKTEDSEDEDLEEESEDDDDSEDEKEEEDDDFDLLNTVIFAENRLSALVELLSGQMKESSISSEGSFGVSELLKDSVEKLTEARRYIDANHLK